MVQEEEGEGEEEEQEEEEEEDARRTKLWNCQLSPPELGVI